MKDQEMDAHLLDSAYAHRARCSTMEDSIEDAAAKACLGLRGHHLDEMKEDHN